MKDYLHKVLAFHLRRQFLYLQGLDNVCVIQEESMSCLSLEPEMIEDRHREASTMLTCHNMVERQLMTRLLEVHCIARLQWH